MTGKIILLGESFVHTDYIPFFYRIWSLMLTIWPLMNIQLKLFKEFFEEKNLIL